MIDKEPVDRIPYDYWINSQFSTARHFGGCKINGVEYECDFDSCRTEVDDNGDTKYFPDLVKCTTEKK